MSRALSLAALLCTLAGIGVATARPSANGHRVHALAAIRAAGVRVDTLLLGGFASGSFHAAVRTIANDLSSEEQSLVASHLERIFSDGASADELGRTGRLRLAYERVSRPDGATRAIRILGVELAAEGRVYTAFYFERGGQPAYFDPFGHALEFEGWSHPLPAAKVTSPFGAQRLHPILKRILPHTGVDLAAASGTAVHAPADGLVTHAETRGGYGLLLELQHSDGYTTRFAHLSGIAPGLARGHLVRRGERIGYVGMTGVATGPHLHYEVRRGGRALDPQRVMSNEHVAASVAGDPRWPHERDAISSLLSRTPAMVHSR